MNKVVVNLQFACKNNKNLPKKRQFRTWLNGVLSGYQRRSEITIRLVDKEESRKLNLIYRGKNNPTNVLSFPFEAPLNIKTSLLGDLVICKQIVEQEGIKKKSLETHWAHIVIHGCLHLLGYNHIEDISAREMESVERKILLTLGYDDSYTL